MTDNSNYPSGFYQNPLFHITECEITSRNTFVDELTTTKSDIFPQKTMVEPKERITMTISFEGIGDTTIFNGLTLVREVMNRLKTIQHIYCIK